MVSKKAKETLKKLDEGAYRNTNEVVLGGVKYSAKDVLLKAPLVSRLNMYYVGGTGEGKTQIANDLVYHLSDSAVYAMGRNDFEPSELMKSINWDLLKALQSGDKIEEGNLEKLSSNVDKVLYYVDEFNRCKPIVQNYFFDFFDGKFVHQGEITNLGKKGYSIGFASGNLGNGEYVGVSDSDRAMKDRMHMIVSLDDPQFNTTSFDDFMIFSGVKKDPRASLPEKGKGITNDIIEANKEFGERGLNIIYSLIGVYLSKGLDWLGSTKRNSKRAINVAWRHGSASGVDYNTDEGKIFPLSKRAVLGAQALASSLEFIAEAKGKKVNNPVKLFLDGLKLTVPYSGVLHPTFVDQKFDGDVYSAFDDAFETSKEDIVDKKDNLEDALFLAEAGEFNNNLLKEISPSVGRWTPVVEAIKGYAKFRKSNPSEDGIKLKEIIEEAKKSVEEK